MLWNFRCSWVVLVRSCKSCSKREKGSWRRVVRVDLGSFSRVL